MGPIEEHSMKKGFDRQIFARLLAYTHGYRKYISFSFLLLVFVIGIELTRPIILGIAVDDVISQYDSKVVTEDSKGQEVVSTLLYPQERGSYYLLDKISEDDYQLVEKGYDIVSIDDDLLIIEAGNQEFELRALSQEEIEAFRSTDFTKLGRLALLYVILTIVGVVINYFQMIILHYTGQKIIYNIREEVFAHLQGLSIQFFNNEPVGKLVTRVTNDTETLNEMYTNVIVNSVRNILMMVGILTTMFIINVKMTLHVLVIVPFLALSVVLFRKYSRKAYQDVRTQIANINTFLSEHISGMRIVQIFAREEVVFEKFRNNNKNLRSADLKQLFIFSLFRPFMYLLMIVSIAITVYFGGSMVLSGGMTVGVLIIFLQYVSNFFDPIQQLAEQFNILQSAMAAAEKIFTLLDVDTRIDNPTDPKELSEVKGKIEFRNVWFAYDKENWVLKDVSFIAEPGQTVAFVGATGAGKTSILNLISKYYTIQKGEILIDDIPIQYLRKEDIRQRVGQMLQDVFIFTGDIKSNIRLRNEDIPFDEIRDAAEYVNASKFIKSLPKQYDEPTYERGATFSAGQRQLISFARTLAFKPSVLVLDEATANIDTETELLIQDALKKLMEGRTTLVVAHRLSTIQHADKIIVLHKGKIKESGNHQELLNEKGIYYSLYKLQYAD